VHLLHCVAAALLVTCSACTGGAGDAGAPPHEAPRPGPASPAAWVVSERAAGPLRIGMTVAAASRALGARLVPVNAAGPGCDMAEPPGAPADFSVMLIADTLVRFDILDTGTLTAEGVGVGSSEAAVFAAYPGRVTVEPHKYGGPEEHYLIVPAYPDSAYAYVFETDGRKVTQWRAGRREEVAWVEGCA
jgi:hypothetical protein